MMRRYRHFLVAATYTTPSPQACYEDAVVGDANRFSVSRSANTDQPVHKEGTSHRGDLVLLKRLISLRHS
jgi:hypothetical protein